jgi:hypothetical protein
MYKNFKSVGLKDMHVMQVKALLDFVGQAIDLAAATDEVKTIREVETAADELVQIFGGGGVKVNVKQSV